jgi:hypothetical protein
MEMFSATEIRSVRRVLAQGDLRPGLEQRRQGAGSVPGKIEAPANWAGTAASRIARGRTCRDCCSRQVETIGSSVCVASGFGSSVCDHIYWAGQLLE